MAENASYVGTLAIENSNPFISNIKIYNNLNGGGIYCNTSTSIFRNIVLQGNNNQYWTMSDVDPAIYSGNSKILFENTIITDYNADRDGGILYSQGSDISFINSTIAGNSVSNECSSILLDNNSSMIMINSILWNKAKYDIKFGPEFSNSVDIAYSNVYGSQEAIISNSMSAVNWLDGNINLNPLFVDTANHNYHLSSKSPCLGAGIDSIQISDIWSYAPKKDLDGNLRPDPFGSRPDIGAYESQLFTDILENGNELPLIFSLYQNYPNPFNSATVIKYSIPNSSRVIIKVYDILGSEVMTLLNEEKETGYHSIDFNESDLPSGVYFYRIQAGNFNDTKKMILIK